LSLTADIANRRRNASTASLESRLRSAHVAIPALDPASTIGRKHGPATTGMARYHLLAIPATPLLVSGDKVTVLLVGPKYTERAIASDVWAEMI